MRLSGVRYVGLAGSVLVAAGAYRVGALAGAAGQESGVRSGALATPGYAVAFAACVLGLLSLVAAWWRLAGAPVPGPRWTLVTGALWAAPLLVAPPVGSRDVYAYACQGWLWSGGGDPYREGVTSGGCPWLGSVPALWRDTTTPYGPLAILVSGGAAGVARGLPIPDGHRLAVVVGLLRLVALGGACLVAWQGERLARVCGVAAGDAVRLAVVTPLAVVHVASGAHHDALVAGLLVAALAVALGPRRTPPDERGTPAAAGPPGGRTPTLAERAGRVWSRGSAATVAAGALVGLAGAIKITAVVAVPFVVLLARREPERPSAGSRWGVPVRSVVLAGGGAVAAFGLVTLVAGLGFGWVSALGGTTALKQWTSPPTAVGMAVGYLLSALGWRAGYDTAIAGARALGVAALAAVLVALWWRATRAAEPARIVAACGWALAAVVLLAPVLYPWYLLAPLAVLAASVPEPEVRRGLAVATVVASLLVFPDGLGVAVLTKVPGAIAVTVLLGVSAWLALRRSRVPLRPGR